MRAALIVACLAALSGCTTTRTVRVEHPYPQEALRLCDELTTPLGDSADAWSRWMSETIALYGTCALRHNTLVREIERG